MTEITKIIVILSFLLANALEIYMYIRKWEDEQA